MHRCKSPNCKTKSQDNTTMYQWSLRQMRSLITSSPVVDRICTCIAYANMHCNDNKNQYKYWKTGGRITDNGNLVNPKHQPTSHGFFLALFVCVCFLIGFAIGWFESMMIHWAMCFLLGHRRRYCPFVACLLYVFSVMRNNICFAFQLANVWTDDTNRFIGL